MTARLQAVCVLYKRVLSPENGLGQMAFSKPCERQMVSYQGIRHGLTWRLPRHLMGTTGLSAKKQVCCLPEAQAQRSG